MKEHTIEHLSEMKIFFLLFPILFYFTEKMASSEFGELDLGLDHSSGIGSVR